MDQSLYYSIKKIGLNSSKKVKLVDVSSSWMQTGDYVWTNARYDPTYSSAYTWVLHKYNPDSDTWSGYATYQAPNGWSFSIEEVRNLLQYPSSEFKQTATINATIDASVGVGLYRVVNHGITFDLHINSTNEDIQGVGFYQYGFPWYSGSPDRLPFAFEVVCMAVNFTTTFIGSTSASGGRNYIFTATAAASGGTGPYTYDWTFPSGAINITGDGTETVRWESFSPSR